ncbi:hypothetical protein [Rothia nasimurium]|uniref:hypothetical protein n=1 Tax=Rothia nasimurium TaxID=85336 RepID=UPI003B9F0397
MVVRQDNELTDEVMELAQALAALVEAEAWEMKERLARLVREGKVKDASWAPEKKEEWGSYVKVQDEQGQTVAFIDRSDGQVVEPVEVAGDDVFLTAEEDASIDFEVGRDELVNVGKAAWLVAREPVDEHHLPEGELVTDEQARVIAEEKLGWEWADEPTDGLMDGSKPVVVASDGVQVPDGVPVVVSGEWSWADDEPVASVEGEPGQAVEGSWSAFGETELTRGATVPVGTVAEPGQAREQAVADQQYQQFQEQADRREMQGPGWE